MKTILLEKPGRMLELMNIEDVYLLLKDQKISFNQRVYEEGLKKWIPIYSHPSFKSLSDLWKKNLVHKKNFLDEVKDLSAEVTNLKNQKAIDNINFQFKSQFGELNRNLSLKSSNQNMFNDYQSEFKENTSNTKLESPPKSAKNSNQAYKEATKREWYYLVGSSPVGAFTYPEMIGLLQNNKLNKKTRVWRQGLCDWVNLCDVIDFSAAQVKSIIQNGQSEINNFIKKRAFNRVSFQAKFILHDEAKLWRGLSLLLSPKGISMLVNSSELKIGQDLYLHKISGGSHLQINAVAKIVSKDMNGLRPGQAIYGFVFEDISGETQKEIIRQIQLFMKDKISA